MVGRPEIEKVDCRFDSISWRIGGCPTYDDLVLGSEQSLLNAETFERNLGPFCLSVAGEIMLAQEQSVMSKSGLFIGTQGTLILTDRRLIFVEAKKEEKIRTGSGFGDKALRFTDVEDLSSIPSDSSAVAIPLSAITMAKGHHSIVEEPKLAIHWNDGATERKIEFVQGIIGGRTKNLNDWARVIEGLKSGQIRLETSEITPAHETLEGKIFHVLGDMQDKGVLEIENHVEQEFKIDLDPDDVELVRAQLVIEPRAIDSQLAPA